MIAVFPEPYPDELVYSVFARYFAMSGYRLYRSVAEDILRDPHSHPDVLFLGRCSEDAAARLAAYKPLGDVVMKHTMFPCLARFWLSERRRRTFEAITRMEGMLLRMARSYAAHTNVLRYCPLCAEEDRRELGETFWHRVHQIGGIAICPKHVCRLVESDALISAGSPRFVSAEEQVPDDSPVAMCQSETEVRLARYIAEVFDSDIDLDNAVPVRKFLVSRLEGTEYLSARGQQRDMVKLTRDFDEFYAGLDSNPLSELWQLEKVLTGASTDLVEVCMTAMFLRVTPEELANIHLPDKTQAERFDEAVFRLKGEGKGPTEISRRLGASVATVRTVLRKDGIEMGGRKKRSNCKGGAKPKDWEQIDREMLPKVKKVVAEMKGDGSCRPKRVSIAAVERALGLATRSLSHMSMCRREVEKHTQTSEEDWASEVLWAVRQMDENTIPMRWTDIRRLINIRRKDFIACLPYLREISENNGEYDRIAALAHGTV